MGREIPDSESRKQQPEPNWAEGNVINPFLNGLVVTPYNAAANAVNFVTHADLLPKKEALRVAEAEPLSGEWFTQNIAGGLGAIVPYVAAGKVVGAGMRGAAGKMAAGSTAAAFMKSDIAAQVVGAGALDFARDTRPGETRFGNAVGGAAAFYVFGKGNALAQTENFWLRQGARAGIGAGGGMANITASSLLSGHALPEWKALGEAAVAGGTMNLVLPPLQKAMTPSEVRDAYYRAKWETREAYHDTRRAGYALLNRYNMRHPLDRIMHGDDAIHTSGQRAPLTPENNPVKAFEAEAPEFFKTIQERENLIEQTADRKQQYEIYEGMKVVRTGFGEKLLRIWHGTADKPGMKAYTDAELATTGGVPLERIAQIREVLSSNLQGKYPEPAEFTTKLGKLIGVDTEGLSAHHDNFALNEIGTSRENFWRYDERAIVRRLGMSSIHRLQDHHYSTPLDWMPFDATPELANLFHGSMSESLAPIITERAMLPAWEIRLRGINQKTGESANEEFPRSSISLTRDFTEAFAYHRHSPQHLTDFPMVFGVSKNVISRGRSAGSLEAGEILINRLRFGDSMFGLRKSDVTNLYVPDAEVGTVAQQLAQRRIRGVRVVGLSELPTPQWKPEPSIETLQEMYPFG